MSPSHGRRLRVAGLFAGIGGLEIGLEKAGHTTEFLCELDPGAKAVLTTRFPGTRLETDVRAVKRLPDVDLVTAGFPCQDLSLAGTQAGLDGHKSGLVGEVLRLIRRRPPEFVLLENVLYLVKRQYGALITQITDELERLGYRWAYRVVDTRGFGLPQRRQRVLILASCGAVDPVRVLLGRQTPADVDDRINGIDPDRMYGFYWTEGKRAVGWAVDAVPTIKGGSGLGIPSPPALFDPVSGFTGTPSIRDGERLQGFPVGWTDVAVDGRPLKVGKRWSLVGNAVSAPVSTWLGKELASSGSRPAPTIGAPHDPGTPMPFAASRQDGCIVSHDTSLHVAKPKHVPIKDFLRDPLAPLSARAINGFIDRAESGVMTMPRQLIACLREQARR